MDGPRVKANIERFLLGQYKHSVDNFCLYQWMERCVYHKWAELGLNLYKFIHVEKFDKTYRERIQYLAKDLQRQLSDQPGQRHPTELLKSHISYTFRGSRKNCSTAIDVLHRILEEFAQMDSSFLQKFISRKHGNRRRYVSPNKSDLYPGRPDLSTQSRQLSNGWWMGTNYGKMNIARIIELACDVAVVSYGTDLIVELGGSVGPLNRVSARKPKTVHETGLWRVLNSSRSRRPRGQITNTAVFRPVIIEALKELGGVGKLRTIVQMVEHKMKEVLTDADYVIRPSDGRPVWYNTMNWQRYIMVQEGILKNNSPRGVWELHDEFLKLVKS
jgi:hypothetical protein